LSQAKEEIKRIGDSLIHKPVDREVYLLGVGEIKGLQRVIRLLEDLPDE
tara:strand:- start:17180 stop:17326 length:147 start_codon:yes stop_codon:yes gene_type:complete